MALNGSQKFSLDTSFNKWVVKASDTTSYVFVDSLLFVFTWVSVDSPLAGCIIISVE